MRGFIVALLLLFSSNHTYAWGDKGHEVIALIAWHYLSPEGRHHIETLLQRDNNDAAIAFANAATWADTYRDSDRGSHFNRDNTSYEQTRRWHYINLKLDHPDIARACFGSPPLKTQQEASKGPAKACIIDKVNQFAAEIRASQTSATERLLALQFIIHLVGDLHQPLHASDNDDGGGNEVRISAKGFKRGTLHGYWDGAVVAKLGRKPETIAHNLIVQSDPQTVSQWRKGTPRDWALESFAMARNVVYADLPPADSTGVHPLNERYAAAAKAAAAQQLLKAGVRLAWLLEPHAKQKH